MANRKIKVYANNHSSFTRPQHSGIPQESPLSVILFLSECKASVDIEKLEKSPTTNRDVCQFKVAVHTNQTSNIGQSAWYIRFHYTFYS